MPVQSKETIIRALFAAYLSNDRKAVENYVHRRLPVYEPV